MKNKILAITMLLTIMGCSAPRHRGRNHGRVAKRPPMKRAVR